MKVIHDELGDDEEEIAELEKRIRAAKMPEATEKKVLKELRRMRKMTATNPDASVSRTYIECLIDIPWTQKTEDNKDLKKAKQILDADHYGMDKIKRRILEYLAVVQLTDSLNGPILCFVGPPGVGKTSIAKSIASCLNRKFVRMSLGGVRDEAEIRGHRRTYIGSIPGKIIYQMKQAGVTNPVFLLDEVDKMASDYRGDPAAALLEVLDPEQNNTFDDHYLEVPYDLSNVLFVTTANSTDSIPAPLIDRMEIIELSGYTDEEKQAIGKNFLLPKQEKIHGIKKGTIEITYEAFIGIISSYTKESGVRGLERELAKICRKIAKRLVDDKSITSVKITPDKLEDYLEMPRYKIDLMSEIDVVGSATGLAWTAVGGTTLTVDVTLMKGKGEVQLTGQLGDVMKESARTAISLIRSMAADFGIDPEIFKETDIHIHVPEGAIPKDGPSAGITMATAILSAFTGNPVNKNVAMTGEITLRGRVLPIGGLKEKSLAAYRAGYKTIIIPKENEKDIVEIPKTVRDKVNIILSDNIKSVFDNALC
jgi:ATP-dependent Lon protease